MKRTTRQSGFTLVEMIVSVGLFVTILFIATSAFLSVVNADRKSRAVRIETDNLNLALEDMQRRIKTGTTYYCGNGGQVTGTNNCPSGAEDYFSFTDQTGVRTTYHLNHVENAIYRDTDNPPGSKRVTSPEIAITKLHFIVRGSAPYPTDKIQPYVTMTIDGTISPLGGASVASTTFKFQSTVTQRAYDI